MDECGVVAFWSTRITGLMCHHHHHDEEWCGGGQRSRSLTLELDRFLCPSSSSSSPSVDLIGDGADRFYRRRRRRRQFRPKHTHLFKFCLICLNGDRHSTKWTGGNLLVATAATTTTTMTTITIGQLSFERTYTDLMRVRDFPLNLIIWSDESTP